MPATFLIATSDPGLFSTWVEQLPIDRAAISLHDGAIPARLSPGAPIVAIIDAKFQGVYPQFLERCISIVIGEPNTQRYEDWKRVARTRHCLSYEESKIKLSEVLPLLEELAEKNATIDLLMEKMRRHDSPRVPPLYKGSSWIDNPEIWDFLEGAVENLSSRDRVLGEFRRASRYLLRASHTVFFLREDSGFRADRGASFLSLDEPLIGYLSNHPLVLDGVDWPGPSDPVAELAVRNRLALWGARLLVPLHENAHLVGLIICGVRDDGQPYDDSDKARAVFVGRLLKQFLASCGQLAKLALYNERARLGEKYLPRTLLLTLDEEPPRTVPLAVRALIGRVRRVRDVRRIVPTPDQPFRASAGFIPENDGVWAFWEEASSELFDRAQRSKVERLDLLRELALTLNHEIGNALVSLTTVRHLPSQSMPTALVEAVRADISRLETLNEELHHLAALAEASIESVDLRTIITSVGKKCDIRAEVGPEPVVLIVASKLIDFALQSIVSSIVANRLHATTREISIQLRAAGSDDKLTALVSIKGRDLELEGILPETTPESTPNQGRMGVFIGKEVIRLHGGSIHSGPGIEGTEILISLKRW